MLRTTPRPSSLLSLLQHLSSWASPLLCFALLAVDRPSPVENNCRYLAGNCTIQRYQHCPVPEEVWSEAGETEDSFPSLFFGHITTRTGQRLSHYCTTPTAAKVCPTEQLRSPPPLPCHSISACICPHPKSSGPGTLFSPPACPLPFLAS